MTGVITVQQRVIGGPTSGDHRRWVYEHVRYALSKEIVARLIDGREYVVQQAKDPYHTIGVYPDEVVVQMWATVFLRNAEDARVGEYVVHSSISYKPQGQRVVLAVSRTEGFGIEVEQRHFDLERIRIEDRTIEAWRRVE